jgi:hypothetical protein
VGDIGWKKRGRTDSPELAKAEVDNFGHDVVSLHCKREDSLAMDKTLCSDLRRREESVRDGLSETQQSYVHSGRLTSSIHCVLRGWSTLAVSSILSLQEHCQRRPQRDVKHGPKKDVRRYHLHCVRLPFSPG